MKSARALFVIGTLASLLWPPAGCALQPSLAITQYYHTAWTIGDNFLKGSVRAITQTPDGYLWLGTEFGLVRFDGVRFVAWNRPEGQHLPSTNIRSLVAARDGTLWIGTLEGLASWKEGKLSVYPNFDRQNVLSLFEDRDNIVWAGTFGVPKGKLCAILHGETQCYGDDGSLGQWVWSIYQDSEGRLWAGAQTGLWRWKPGPPMRYPVAHTIQTAQSIVDGDNRGELLAITEGIWRFAHEKLDEYLLATPPGRLTPVNMFRDRDGGLWVGTLQRGILHVYQGKTTLFAQTDGLSSDRILTVFEDQEGNIWVGTSEGLDRFRETSISSISAKQGLSSPSIWTVLVAHDNSVWMSTLDGLNQWKNGHVTIYRPASRTANQGALRRTDQQPPTAWYGAGTQPQVTEISDPGLPDDVGSLFEDDRRRIWVSSPHGIARFEHGRFGTVRDAPAGWVNAITGDSSAGVWISYQDHGLVHFVDDRVVERIPWSKLGGNVIASSVLPDPRRGGLWLGFFEGGVAHVIEGQVRTFYGRNEGLGHGRVMGLQLDADGTLWAATEGGLSRITGGQVITMGSGNGLPCDTVHWSVQLDDSLWLYTSCGLIRVARTELDKWTSDPARKIQFTLFDSADGVRSHPLLTGYTPRISKSMDGKLWFAHFESVSVVDPGHLKVNAIAPPVHIEQIIADNKIYAGSSRVRLPPLIHDLGITYTALSLAVPEKVRFRFKLEGQDKDWREIVNGRQIQYSNLGPGPYRFRVTACNNSGVWNEQGDSLEFSVDPAYYQTNWFHALLVATVLLFLWTAYQFRVRQLHHEFDMKLEARVGERTRIARELHDTLLQSFHGILLHLQTVSNQLPSEQTKQKLDAVIDQAEHAIIEGRDAVQGLRAATIDNNDLALAIRTLGEELAATESASCRPHFTVQVEGTPRNLRPILRDELYRIIGESLRNAFRHAAARRIEAEIRYDDRELRVCVRDDGKGMDPRHLSNDGPAGHFGLRGMRERSKLIGGKLTVWSKPDSGTEVDLSIAGERAYVATQERRRSRLFQKLAGKFERKGKDLES